MGLSTLTRNASFRVELVRGSVTLLFDRTYTLKELPNYIAASRDETTSVGEAWPPASPLLPYISTTSHASMTKSAVWSMEKGLWAGGKSCQHQHRRKGQNYEKPKFCSCSSLCCKVFNQSTPGFPLFLVILLHRFDSLDRSSYSILSTFPLNTFVTAIGTPQLGHNSHINPCVLSFVCVLNLSEWASVLLVCNLLTYETV